MEDSSFHPNFNFCKNNGVKYTTSSAYHPRSNEEAERFVQSFKTALKKTSDGLVDVRLQRFLFTCRITLHATTGVAPCELLQGRTLRSKLDLIRPDVEKNVRDAQRRQVSCYDTKAKPRNLNIGQTVWVKTHSKNDAKLSLGSLRKAMGPVSFTVEVDGRMIKRHMDHILSAIPASLTNIDVDGNAKQNTDDQSTPIKSQPGSTHQTPVKMQPLSVPSLGDNPVDPVPETEDYSKSEGNLNSSSSRPRRNPKPIQRYGAS